ncbi:MAG: toll/interleukin-1 receptor domain-containing protein [Ruminococcaceae bacterium]|nr:toll/interleukin-1 receptor domain-containing protein [Oscillospiraceae bacterium]
MRVFISHSSENSAEAEKICGYIEKEGHKCFLAPRDIRSGHEYAEEIINGIDGSDVMLLLLSEKANSSPHVLREIERAVSKKIAIMVYKLEDVKLSKSMEYFLMTHQWLNTKSGEYYSTITACINEFANRRDSEDVKSEEILPTEPAQKYNIDEKSKREPAVIVTVVVIAVAVVLCIVGAVIGFGLLNGDDAQSSLPEASEPTSSSNVESTEAPPATQQSTTTIHTEPATTSATTQTTTEATTTSATTATSATTSTTATSATTQNTTSATQTTTTEKTVVSEPVSAERFALGDTIVLGEYNDEPIEWRIIKFSDDGNSAVVIADRILTMKCFDAAEGGKYNYLDGNYYWSEDTSALSDEQMRLIRGDNRWELSNIRTWLNSDREYVTYKDQPPSLGAMSELKNAYDTEKGFLSDFSKKELAAILTTNVETNGTVTNDRVFLLSDDELEWLVEADVSKYGRPTDAAVEQDMSAWYQLYVNEYSVNTHYWWLRSTDADTVCEAHTVTNSLYGGKISSESVGLEGFGIRPAMTIDLSSGIIAAE